MDRDYYRSLTEAYQSIYEAPGAGVIGGQVLRQGGKIGGSLASQKALGWPEYVKYRDQGLSDKDARIKVGEMLGINVAGSLAGGLAGSALGPKGSLAGGVLGGPAATAMYDAFNKSYTDKQLNQRQGIVWDDKSGKYVFKPENLTYGETESPEDWEKRNKEGDKRAKELNAVEGGPQAPEWLGWERKREKERAKEAANKERALSDGEGASGTRGASQTRTTPGSKTYTVSGIEYDRATGRPVTPPPSFSRNPPTSETETETETQTTTPQGTETTSSLDDTINAPYTADQNLPDNKTGDVVKPEGGNVGSQAQQKPDITRVGKNSAGLTPFQQWAQKFPHLAKKVKPGQAGYDEINKMPSQKDQQASTVGKAASQLKAPKFDTKTTPAVSGLKKPQSFDQNKAQNNTSTAYDPGNTLGQDWDDEPLSPLTRKNDNQPSLYDRAMDKMKGAANSNVGQRAQQATQTAIDATKKAARKAAGSQAVRTVTDQAKKGASRLNNAVRNRLGNNDNE